MRAAVLVKESFDHDIFLRRNHAQRYLRGREIIRYLLRGAEVNSDFVSQPFQSWDTNSFAFFRISFIEFCGNLCAQSRDRDGKFFTASGRFAEPEGNRWRLTFRV